MTNLSIAGVTKRYRTGTGSEVVAVDDLNIDLEAGEFLVLVGPSGCGKSTTLECVAGLVDVTDGEIRIGDDVVNEKTPEERNIAMVFQNYALYPHMTARKNMAFGLKMATDLSSAEIEDRVNEAARLLDIAALLDDKPKELSGGQQQRVALGRAIVREPDVFLMDEPLSNLDAKLRTQMRTEIQKLQNELHVTTVYVTHDQTEAMTMGDRIAILNDGKLQQVGTPLDCYYEPANLFVAGFIGEPSMNFFETHRDGQDLVGDGIEYPLSEDVLERLGNTEHVTVGIRPEDIEIVADDGPHTVTATVQVIEPMGNENFLHVDVDGTSVVAAVSGEARVDPETVVRLKIPEDKVHLFDTERGTVLVNREQFNKELPAVTTYGEVSK